MVYRSWSTYLEALATYKAAYNQCDLATQQWNARLKSFDTDSNQANTVSSLGCLTVIGAGVIVYVCGAAESLWGWGVLWAFVFGGYHSLDEKCRECQKQRFLATTPCPRFTLQEPTYEPPDEHRAPPPRRAPKLTSDLALTTLGLSRSATLADVKSAYREQIRQYHPDRVAHLGAELKDLAEHKSKEINAAYELLLGSFQARTDK